MGEVVIGAAGAVIASALFSVGVVLQGLEARRVPAGHAQRLALVAQLVRRPRWLLGTALMVVGFVLHAGSLLLAPLTVVQPALSAGLLVLLALAARSDGEPVGARELAAVAAITVGLVGLTLTAPDRTTVSAGPVALVLVLGALAAVALAPYLAPGLDRRRVGALLPALAAGAAYALTAVTTKLFSDRLDGGDWLGAVLWLGATALAGLLALLDQTTALQRGRTTQVGVIVYVVPVVVPVLLAPVLVGESWASSPAGGLPLALSIAAVCAGAGVLGASRRIGALEHPAPAT
jgi:drug/metabolite transporter (DMT)-like permease